jgi:hypothetical protein
MIFRGFLRQSHYTAIIPLNSISPCNNDKVHITSSALSYTTGSQDSIVTMVIRIWTGQPRKYSSTLSRGKDFSLLHNIQTGSGKYPTSYSMGAGGSFSLEKEAAALS